MKSQFLKLLTVFLFTVAFSPRGYSQEDRLPIMVGDHYQCYDVLEHSPLAPVSLSVADQFGKSTIVVARPIVICNPTIKTHNGRVFPISKKNLHLVCYQIEKTDVPPIQRTLAIGNQLGQLKLLSGAAKVFCVPSSKKLIKIGQ